MRTDSPLLNGSDLCMSFREQKLRAQAGEDEKVVRIRGCLAVVKKSRFELALAAAVKAVKAGMRLKAYG